MMAHSGRRNALVDWNSNRRYSGPFSSLRLPIILVLLYVSIFLFRQFRTPLSVFNQLDELVVTEEEKEVKVFSREPAIKNGRVCEAIGRDSAMSIWTEQIGHILNASQLPIDRAYVMHDNTAAVLKLITPRIQLAQRSVPRNWKTVGVLIQKIDERLRYLHADGNTDKGQVVPPPIKILVMGGSVTMGVNCYGGVPRSNNYVCSWANRLEKFVNRLAGGELVVIHNTAFGGTNSKTGRALLEYDLLPDYATNPDIVINAYSTNDMHVLTMMEAKAQGVSLRDMTFDMNQDFVRTVLSKCMPTSATEVAPLLLYLDDYLGNEQREILATTEFSQGIQVLANYYGFGFFSYGDVVRDLVYGTTDEMFFSPAGWYNKQRGPAMRREIHPQVGMHLATTFIFAFHMLQLASSYCRLEPWNVIKGEATQYNASIVPGLPPLRLGNVWGPVPNPTLRSLPPRLHPKLSLETVSAEWREAEAAQGERSCQSISTTRRCPVSWISGLDRARNDEKSVNAYFEPFVVQPAGWEFIDDTGKGKFGFSPKQPPDGTMSEASPATMILNFASLEKVEPGRVVRSLTVFYLKSYGVKWENAKANVRVLKLEDIQSNNNSSGVDSAYKDLASISLVGHHDKETSEMYDETIAWPDTPMAQLRVKLEGDPNGATFKVLGLALCS